MEDGKETEDNRPAPPPDHYEEIRDVGGHFPIGELAFVVALVLWALFS